MHFLPLAGMSIRFQVKGSIKVTFICSISISSYSIGWEKNFYTKFTLLLGSFRIYSHSSSGVFFFTKYTPNRNV